MELFISKIYNQEGNLINEHHYFINFDGSSKVDMPPSANVQNLKYWLDPTDQNQQRAYSHKWRISSVKENYNLTVEPTLDNQMATGWLGYSNVIGSINGNQVTGKAFVNLVKRYSSTLTINDIGDNLNYLSIPNDPVTVNTNISDDLPITDITLFYRINNGSEQSLDMTFGGQIWEATIPGQGLQTEVEYWIVAKDLADKSVESVSYYYKVKV